MALAYGVGDTSGYAPAELMVCEMSRWLANGDTVVVWDDAPLGLAAARLAQLTHAPDLHLLLMPVGALNPSVEPLVLPLSDYAYMVAEWVVPWEQAISLLARGVDLMVAEIEGIDLHGDLVSSLQAPKPAAFPWLTMARRVILYTLEACLWHEGLRVTLVPAAHRGSVGGYRLWRAINPLGSFEPAGRARSLRVRSVHPGLTVAEAVETSGLKLTVAEDLCTTLPPTRREIEVLRSQIDPNGLLRDMAGGSGLREDHIPIV